MNDAAQGPGWWLASDGKWYPPEQVSASAPTAPAAPGGPTTAVNAPATNRAALIAVSVLVAMVLAAGTSAALVRLAGGGGSSHNSAKSIARYCVDSDAASQQFSDATDASGSAGIGELRQMIPVAERLAAEAPSAVHGDIETILTAFKATVNGEVPDTKAMDGAQAHLDAWTGQNCQ